MRSSAERAPTPTSHSRRTASSTKDAHHSAHATAGRSVSSRTLSRGKATTWQGDGMAMEWSMVFRMNTCRSQKSPGNR